MCSIQFSHKCHKFCKFFKPLRCSDQSLFYLDLRVLMMCYYREWHFCFHLSAEGASSQIQLSKVPPNGKGRGRRPENQIISIKMEQGSLENLNRTKFRWLSGLWPFPFGGTLTKMPNQICLPVQNHFFRNSIHFYKIGRSYKCKWP